MHDVLIPRFAVSPDVPHHAYDRAMRDAWRRWPADLVEGLLGRPLPGGATARATDLEPGLLQVDALITDAAGTPIHVEFQTRQDRALGYRMARYFGALDNFSGPPPEQHVVLLHPSADFPGIGTYSRGDLLELRYGVHRLWEIDADVLLSRTGLLRMVPLARATGVPERIELLVRAAGAIREHLGQEDPTRSAEWAAILATLYIRRDVVFETMEGLRMPIDLTDSFLVRDSRAEGATAARRDDVRLIILGRFVDRALAERAASAAESLLEDVISLSATAEDATEITAWLEAHGS